MAILNLEESENDIRSLTAFRPIATIPFAGRYRVIDFILSNIVNANITSVGVFISKNTRSLVDQMCIRDSPFPYCWLPSFPSLLQIDVDKQFFLSATAVHSNQTNPPYRS